MLMVREDLMSLREELTSLLWHTTELCPRSCSCNASLEMIVNGGKSCLSILKQCSLPLSSLPPLTALLALADRCLVCYLLPVSMATGGKGGILACRCLEMTCRIIALGNEYIIINTAL